MRTITGVIEGTTPILFNRPDEKVLEPDDTGAARAGGRKSIAQREEEAMLRLHRDETGIYLPGEMLTKCLVEGAKKSGLKVGRSSLATYLPAEVFAEPKMYMGKQEPDFMHKHWGRVPPRTGAAVILRRPAFNQGWQVPFVFWVIDPRRSADEIKRCLIDAGTLVGMGAWRPVYGRFQIKSWHVSSES